MGSSVTALCSCGYEAANIPIGGGIASHKYLCLFPVYCRGCKQLDAVNLFQGRVPAAESSPPHCRSCGSADLLPYDSPELIKAKGKPIEGWNTEAVLGRIVEITDGEYLCPNCQKFSMTFKSTGLLWD